MSTSKWDDTKYVEKNLLRPDISLQESQKLYKEWAHTGTYDQMLHSKPSDYSALNQLIMCMKELFPNPTEVSVLDVGAGTGLSGLALHEVGFNKIEALEPLQEFAKTAQEKGLYRNVIVDFIGTDKPLNISNDTYDAVVSAGALGPGHIPCSGVVEMVRLIKPGGYMVNCMRHEFLETNPEYKDRLQPLLQKLENEGKIKKIRWDIYENHFVNKPGLLMVYQKC